MLLIYFSLKHNTLCAYANQLSNTSKNDDHTQFVRTKIFRLKYERIQETRVAFSMKSRHYNGSIVSIYAGATRYCNFNNKSILKKDHFYLFILFSTLFFRIVMLCRNCFFDLKTIENMSSNLVKCRQYRFNVVVKA